MEFRATRFLLLLGLINLITLAIAQSPEPDSSIKFNTEQTDKQRTPRPAFRYDTNYIEDISHLLAPAFEILLPTYSLRLLPRALNTLNDSLWRYQFDFQPNLPSLAGLSLSYRVISFSFYFSLPPDEGMDEVYGRSDAFGLSLSMKLNNFYLEGSYRNFQGFSDRYSPTISRGQFDTAYYYNSDLQSKYLKLKARKFFHNARRYSHPSSYAYSEIQKKTTWASFLLAHTYFHNLNTHGRLMHDSLDAAIGNDLNFWKIDVLGIGLAPGLAANVVFLKRFFISMHIATGLDVQFQSSELKSGGNYEAVKLALMGDSRFGLGYNGHRWFGGITIRGDQTQFPLKDYRLVSQYLSTTFSIGYRLTMPKPLENFYFKVNDFMKKVAGVGME